MTARRVFTDDPRGIRQMDVRTSTRLVARENQRPRSKLTGYQTCNAASCGVFDPRGIRQMLVQARHLAHCSRE